MSLAVVASAIAALAPVSVLAVTIVLAGGTVHPVSGPPIDGGSVLM